MQFTSLHKALDIIQLLLDHKEIMDFREISESLNMPRSSAYKYLAVLRDRGFLDFEPNTKRYRLGLKFMELGSLVKSQIRIDQIALPYMKELAEVMKETVILSYLSSGVAYCLERVGPESGLVFSMQRGAHLPLYSGASAKVLLAQLPDSEIDDILKRVTLTSFTPNTITDPEKLRQNIREIKTQGFAYSDQETDWGARAIAAPVVNSKLGIIASLCVVGPAQRMSGKKLEKAKKLVIESARKVSGKLSKP
jgi:DNA-binding IclR family transcriptional regulator